MFNDNQQTNRLQLEQRLVKVHGTVHRSQIEAGRVISELKKSFEHGNGWMEYSKDLYQRIGISQKTAYRYVEAFEQAESIGTAILAEAEKAGLNLNRIPVREALIESKKQNPDATPSKIVDLTKTVLVRKTQPPVEKHFEIADWTAKITGFRSELTGLNQVTKQIQRSSTETGTLISSMRALAQNLEERADRLEVAARKERVA
jgi:hypothetical protein